MVIPERTGETEKLSLYEINHFGTRTGTRRGLGTTTGLLVLLDPFSVMQVSSLKGEETRDLEDCDFINKCRC